MVTFGREASANSISHQDHPSIVRTFTVSLRARHCAVPCNPVFLKLSAAGQSCGFYITKTSNARNNHVLMRGITPGRCAAETFKIIKGATTLLV